MNTDDFEQRLRRQAPRQIPEHWREEILLAARAAATAPYATRDKGKPRSPFVDLLRGILWPSPKAWAGLAALWLIIFALNLASAPRGLKDAERSQLPQTLMALREQERLLSELLQQPERQTPAPSNREKTRPRSERRKASQEA